MLHQRVNTPQLEHDLMRDPSLGFEPLADCGLVRCLEHGFPTPLARWHYHDEYELQLIVETSGMAFVGDYVGNFGPGHLVLTGPRLPHNWISTHATDDQAALTSRLVIQFPEGPLRRALDAVPELDELSRLLERSRHGIEFFGLSEVAHRRFHDIRNSRGTRRFCEFLGLLGDLAACRDFRPLSTAPISIHGDNSSSEGLNRVFQFVNERFMEPISMEEVYAAAGMSQSTFARTFAKTTGTTFTGFVNRFRVAKACELLMHTDHYVAKVAYEVGFNNLANFNRQFVELKKMTPSEFRKAARMRLGTAHR